MRVRKKSATRIAIETTTTVRVVLWPTPSVPPLVFRPKWQPMIAMMKPKMGVFEAREEVAQQHALERGPEEKPDGCRTALADEHRPQRAERARTC